MGGIKEVYLTNHSDVDQVTAETGKITAITMAAEQKFKKYSFRKGTSSMTSTLTVDKSNGVKYYTTDLVMLFSKMETSKREEIEAMADGEMAVIVKDNNGLYWYLGYDEPVMASAGDGQTGTAASDANRYSITLQDQSLALPYEVEASVIETIVE